MATEQIVETMVKLIEKLKITNVLKGIWDCLSGRAEIIQWKRNRELYRRCEDNHGSAVYRLATDRRKWEDAIYDCYCAHCFEIGKLKQLKGDGHLMLNDGGFEYRLTCYSCEIGRMYYFSD